MVLDVCFLRKQSPHRDYYVVYIFLVYIDAHRHVFDLFATGFVKCDMTVVGVFIRYICHHLRPFARLWGRSDSGCNRNRSYCRTPQHAL